MEARPGDVGPPHGDTGDVHGPTGYANYDSFAVGNAASNYVLAISGDYIYIIYLYYNKIILII